MQINHQRIQRSLFDKKWMQFAVLAAAFFIFTHPIHAVEGEIEASHDVIVVGGAMSGITAAFHLQDYDVKVLERSYQIGGRALTQSFHTFAYESAANGRVRNPICEMIDGMGLEILKIISPDQVYVHNNQWFYGRDGLALMLIEQNSVQDFNRFASTVQSLSTNTVIFPISTSIPHWLRWITSPPDNGLPTINFHQRFWINTT
jgi:hypothetical protein